MSFIATEPFRTHRLRVSDLHELHIEECGNPQGVPAVFLHGGPGGGSEPWHREFFDPAKYRLVLFDQRGCGRSTPHAELRENGTWELVADIERIRRYLGIDQWLVFGGSWGSTLALAYAERHPEAVSAMVLRGIFLLRRAEIAWFYQEGASWVYPDAWEHFLAPIPEAERDDMVMAYHRRLTSSDARIRSEAARAWSIWEGSTSKLLPSSDMVMRFGESRFAEAFARIECHYFVNNGFFETDNWLIENVHRIRHIPAVIVQGRYDVVCPMRSAWDLHRAWPEADFRVIADAGHAASEHGTLAQLIEATNRFARD
ncbi:prolyl aminopeptidase [Panacagrimonas perspica]|uniref:Proline iminopeptidase n=1 Tax=Panacagrimonas perspica TaxID=381431 RepID=A0A4R7P3B5_9GAMM|nr:prolyl aminopeptidase [Panacagrimonas perspica]TDU28078.1 prolyl aminopeptidase [Panacagrimonas perspica]THD03492.1 prolyl aminopeptidase [Panacagrimonas perspica]